MDDLLERLYGPDGRRDRNWKEQKSEKQLDAWKAFAAAFSNLAGFMLDDVRLPLKLNVKLGRGRDYLAIAQRAGDVCPENCFGSGESIWMALDNLNQAIARDRWRPDKFAMEKLREAFPDEGIGD